MNKFLDRYAAEIRTGAALDFDGDPLPPDLLMTVSPQRCAMSFASVH